MPSLLKHRACRHTITIGPMQTKCVVSNQYKPNLGFKLNIFFKFFPFFVVADVVVDVDDDDRRMMMNGLYVVIDVL